MDFDGYVTERRQALLRFAVVLCGDPVLAQDIVSDVLGTAYEHWDRIAGADNIHAYVRKMVLNEYLGWRRKVSRLVVRSDVADLLESIPDHADASAVAYDLVAELRQLPSRQRAAVVLRYYEGLSFADIASLLGTGEVAVRTNISRALKRLRVQLTDDEAAVPAAALEA